MAKRILSISNDASLLWTRKSLLEHAGYEVVSPEGFAAAFDACEAENGDFDLVVVGHSIPRADKERIIAHVRKECRCPILVLLRPHESSVRGADLSVEADPNIFLAAVRKMVGRS